MWDFGIYFSYRHGHQKHLVHDIFLPLMWRLTPAEEVRGNTIK